jgi:hypothetical protein
VKNPALIYIIVAIIVLESFLVFQFHCHIDFPVLLVSKLYSQAVFAIAFIKAGVVIRIGNIM